MALATLGTGDDVIGRNPDGVDAVVAASTVADRLIVVEGYRGPGGGVVATFTAVGGGQVAGVFAAGLSIVVTARTASGIG